MPLLSRCSTRWLNSSGNSARERRQIGRTPATNNYRASAGVNGEVKLIVSQKDPGLPNWITTVGHRQGTMLFRWTRPAPRTELPAISVEKVTLASLQPVH